MNLTLFNMRCEKIRLNKDSFIKRIISMEGTCRNAVSISNPSIIIELEPNALNQSIINGTFVVDNSNKYVTQDGTIKLVYTLISQILTANYAYIPEFQRYYFISNITIVRNNLYQIDMNVDVLMSFYGCINNLNCLIARNEKEYNSNIVDKLEYFEYYNDVREYVPTMLEGKQLTSIKSNSVSLVSNNYVINVINDTQESGIAISQVSPSSNVLPVVSGASTPSGSEDLYVLYSGDVKDILSQLINNSSLASYVKSLMVFPFNIPVVSGLTYDSIRLGKTTLTSTRSIPFDIHRLQQEELMNYIHNAYFRIDKPFNDYRDYEPYSVYELYVPYVGWIKLDSNNCLDVNLLLTYVINVNDGSASVILTDETNSKMLWSSTCQLGIKVGISTTNALEVERNRIANNLNMGIGILSSAVGVGVGAVSGNPVAVVGGALSMANTISKGISNEMLNIERAQASISGGLVGLYSPDEVRVRITSHHRLYDDVEIENYLKLYGKPLNMYKTIRECEGYTQVGEVHVENISTATSVELNEIESILKSGIII